LQGVPLKNSIKKTVSLLKITASIAAIALAISGSTLNYFEMHRPPKKFPELSRTTTTIPMISMPLLRDASQLILILPQGGACQRTIETGAAYPPLWLLSYSSVELHNLKSSRDLTASSYTTMGGVKI
jgi:hypothetical protein